MEFRVWQAVRYIYNDRILAVNQQLEIDGCDDLLLHDHDPIKRISYERLQFHPLDGTVPSPPGELALGVVAGVPLNQGDGRLQ